MTTHTIKWDIPDSSALLTDVEVWEINRDVSLDFAHRHPTRTKSMIHAMRVARECNVRIAAARHNGWHHAKPA